MSRNRSRVLPFLASPILARSRTLCPIPRCVMSDPSDGHAAPSAWPAVALSQHNGAVPPHAGSYYVARRPRAPFFEGWYLRVVLPNSTRSFAFMFSIEAGGPGTLQVLDPMDRLHALALPPGNRARFFADARRLSVGHWGYTTAAAGLPRPLPPAYFDAAVLQGYQLSASACHGRFSGDHGLVQWGFEYRPVLAWGERGKRPLCTATWLSRLPLFDPGYQVLMAHGVASGGYVLVGGERIDVTGAAVYCEKNWGSAFPKRWWWVQANAFDDAPDLSVTAVGATRRVLAFEEVTGIIAVHYQGLFYEFTNWSCESLEWNVHSWGSWKASATAKTGHRAEMYAWTEEGPVQVLGPSSDGMVFNVLDNARGHFTISLLDPDGKAILENVTCETAQVEVGGDPWSEAWVASVCPMPQPLRFAINAFRGNVQTLL